MTALSEIASGRVSGALGNLSNLRVNQTPMQAPNTASERNMPTDAARMLAMSNAQQMSQDQAFRSSPQILSERAKQAREVFSKLPDQVREKVRRRPDVQKQFSAYQKAAPELFTTDADGYLSFATPGMSVEQRIAEEDTKKPLSETLGYRQALAAVKGTEAEAGKSEEQKKELELKNQTLKDITERIKGLKELLDEKEKLGLQYDVADITQQIDLLWTRKKNILLGLQEQEANIGLKNASAADAYAGAGMKRQATIRDQSMLPLDLDTRQLENMKLGEQTAVDIMSGPANQQMAQATLEHTQAETQRIKAQITDWQKSQELATKELNAKIQGSLNKSTTADDTTKEIYKTFGTNLEALNKEYQWSKPTKRAEYATRHMELTGNTIRNVPKLEYTDDKGAVMIPSIYVDGATKIAYENSIDEAFDAFNAEIRKNPEQAVQIYQNAINMTTQSYELPAAKDITQKWREGHISEDVYSKLKFMKMQLQAQKR